MAKFPINPGDSDTAIADAINYALSGPGGLGQNFNGFVNPVDQNTNIPANTPAYLTTNFRPPFTRNTPTVIYVPPIALATAQYLDARTLLFTFAVAQSTPPFSPGQTPRTTGTSIPDIYDNVYGGAGVLVCTTTTVTIRITGDGNVYAPATGGTIELTPFRNGKLQSTDCNAKVNVTGGTDKVFITGQLTTQLTYTCTTASTIQYVPQISRRVAIANNDPTNPDFVFAFDATVAVKSYTFSVPAGTGVVPMLTAWTPYWLDTGWSNLLDTPAIGYYWYILELQAVTLTGDAQITQLQFDSRNFSVQVVKT